MSLRFSCGGAYASDFLPPFAAEEPLRRHDVAGCGCRISGHHKNRRDIDEAKKGEGDRDLAERYGIVMIAPHRGVRRVPTQDGRPLRRYRKRWRVERLFAWLHHFRRLVIRWSTMSRTSLAWFAWVACKSCLGIYERSLVPQRHHGIDSSRAAGGNVASEQCDDKKQQGHTSKRQ
jgi:hypothetical protein